MRAGFNRLAVELSSGETQKGIENETRESALAAGARTGFSDAVPDMLAAAKYARAKEASGPIIAWGSSYSAALALKLAGDYPSGFAGVMACSPGEYSESFGKSSQWTQRSATKITVPAFVTSAKGERDSWTPIFDAIPSTDRVSFLPATDGQHGSKALWVEFLDSVDYWDAVFAFLTKWSTPEQAKEARRAATSAGSKGEITRSEGKNVTVEFISEETNPKVIELAEYPEHIGRIMQFVYDLNKGEAKGIGRVAGWTGTAKRLEAD